MPQNKSLQENPQKSHLPKETFGQQSEMQLEPSHYAAAQGTSRITINVSALIGQTCEPPPSVHLKKSFAPNQMTIHSDLCFLL